MTEMNIITASRPDFKRKFWDKVDKSDNCWLWIASKTQYGYGRVSYNGRTIYAHRLAWFIAHGYFPRLFVCHICDNPPCVRPDHLFEGTPKDNIHDSMKKGRRRISTRSTQLQIKLSKTVDTLNTTAVFTAQQAKQIIKEYRIDHIQQRELAKKYGVHYNTINRIIRSRDRYREEL